MERHDLDPISLVFGLAFTVLGLLFFAGPVAPGVLAWAFPLMAIGLAVGIFVTARRQSARVDTTTDPSPIEGDSDSA
jgi:hypothetical protein